MIGDRVAHFEEVPIDRAIAGAALVLSAIFAYFTIPILRFTDPSWLATMGLAFGVFASGTLLWVLIDRHAHWQKVMVTGLLVTMFGLAWQIVDGFRASDENDLRCAVIQKDMLSGHPRYANATDLFQALGCRPQKDSSVEYRVALMERVTKELDAAKRPPRVEAVTGSNAEMPKQARDQRQ